MNWLENKKVLVVDDTTICNELTVWQLKSMWIPNNNITVVTNWLDAVEAVRNATSWKMFDIILMDIKMPWMNGIQTANQILALCWDKPPIVALTANRYALDDPEAEVFSKMTLKPVDKKVLAAIIAALTADSEDNI